MSNSQPSHDDERSGGRQAVGMGVSMLPTDLDNLERIKQHFGINSTAAAVRLALTIVVRQIEAAPVGAAA